ncbi:MAG: TlpA family protein disulfide reductase [Myxococcales bacterium]|nr:TlpA family protein disulfide reductase [Myxococcales bacterium]MCB9735765.1 TlpA family protein disulfide reductase [Deltaproteobacteria bacterium]
MELIERVDAKRVFLWLTAAALAVTLMALILGGIRAGGREGLVKELLAETDAEIIDAPLTEQQARWPLEMQDGQRVELSQLPRDTLVFVNFWATWCPPCRNELPSMLKLRQSLGDRRFAMIAVSYDDDWDAISTFFKAFRGGIPAPSELFVLRDTAGDGQLTLRETFGTTKLPDSYVVMNGRVLARFVNVRNWTHPSIVDYFRLLAPAR